MDSVVMGNAVVVTVDKRHAGTTVGDMLRTHFYLPEGFLKTQFREGQIRVGSQAAVETVALEAGQRVRLMGGVEEPIDVEPKSWGELDVLYEDDHALIVNKPAGLLIYPGSDADNDTLAHRVAGYFAAHGLSRKIRHAHRLDRDTTGAVLYAKHAYSARTFDSLLVSHQVVRTYAAVVLGKLQPPQGTIDASIGRDRHVAGRYRVSQNGKEARTHYRTLATTRKMGQSASFVACVLETGRTHQIRVHMAHRGAPVAGDALYGSGHKLHEIPWSVGYGLHAASLAFFHPYVEREVRAVAPVPESFCADMTALGFAPTWQDELEKAILHADNIRG